MSCALGILKWSPCVFWASSMYEYTAAMKGHLVSKGVKLKSEGMTRGEFLTMKARIEKDGRLIGK